MIILMLETSIPFGCFCLTVSWSFAASENGLNISCPYMDDNGTKCEQMISQQEIRAALDQESFEKLLQSAISQAEAAEPNRYILTKFPQEGQRNAFNSQSNVFY